MSSRVAAQVLSLKNDRVLPPTAFSDLVEDDRVEDCHVGLCKAKFSGARIIEIQLFKTKYACSYIFKKIYFYI